MTIFREPPVLRLSDEANRQLREELLALGHPEDDVDHNLALAHKAFWAALPVEMCRMMTDFGRHVAAPAVMLVENLPQDPSLPGTPTDGGPAQDKQTFVSEGVLLGLTSMIGEPVAFSTEKDGRIVHDIVPTASGANTQTSQASKVFLNFHNDIVHDENGRYDVSNPDFLVLNCLRGARTGQALTYYTAALDLLERLPVSTVAVLRQPRFRLNAPGGYTRMYAGGKEVWSEPVALIAGPDSSPEVFLAANGVQPLDEEAQAAFDAVQQVCRESDATASVNLAPGNALLINNRKGVHARDSFQAAFDGQDRWLQRTYVRRTMWSIRDKALPGDNQRLHQ